MVDSLTTTCAISGGGPAGMMLGLLLARAGVDVVVLEKHKDFLRDFRGDTIHPSTIDLMDELGVIDEFFALPHNKVSQLSLVFGEEEMAMASFDKLKIKHPYIAFMPQWDFLNFLADHAAAYPTFTLKTCTESMRLMEEDGCVKGLIAQTPEGELEIHADLTIAADGRFSVLRDQSGLELREFGAPMDVLWFHLQKPEGVVEQPFGRFLSGKILILIDRDTYWQCGYVIPKGVLENMRKGDFAIFREEIAKTLPELREPLKALTGWDDLKLLNVQVNRLTKWWCPGFLCIGDAAHAMSPVGGVGINLAIQDAVAAANILSAPLRENRLTTNDLKKVQQRRMWPAKATQWFQLLIQARIISSALDGKGEIGLPLPFRIFRAFPYLLRLPAKLIGMGVRPEHITSKEVTR